MLDGELADLRVVVRERLDKRAARSVVATADGEERLERLEPGPGIGFPLDEGDQRLLYLRPSTRPSSSPDQPPPILLPEIPLQCEKE